MKSVKKYVSLVEMTWFPDDLWHLIKEFAYDPQYYLKEGHGNSLAKRYRDCIPIFKGMFSYVTYRQVLLIRPHRPSNREFFALKDTVLYKSIEKAIKEIFNIQEHVSTYYFRSTQKRYLYRGVHWFWLASLSSCQTRNKKREGERCQRSTFLKLSKIRSNSFFLCKLLTM